MCLLCLRMGDITKSHKKFNIACVMPYSYVIMSTYTAKNKIFLYSTINKHAITTNKNYT